MILLEIDPNVVKPGWTPLVITIVLAAAIVFLYFSMKKQFRRINIPAADGDDAPEGTNAAPSAPTSTVKTIAVDPDGGSPAVDITKPAPGSGH
jgi:hypothetical protein